jgi:hypothetical protein
LMEYIQRYGVTDLARKVFHENYSEPSVVDGCGNDQVCCHTALDVLCDQSEG